MDYLLSFLLIGIEEAAFYFLHGAFLSQRKHPKLWWLVLIAAALLAAAINQSGIGIAGTLLIAALNFSVYLYLFSGSFLWHILLLVLTIVLTGIIDTCFLYGTSFLLDISLDVLTWRKLQYVIIVVTGKLLTLFSAWLIRYFRKRQKHLPIRASWLAVILIFPIVSIAMLFVVFYGYRNSNDLSLPAFIFSIALAIANIGILYLIQKIELQTRQEQEIALLSQQMEIQSGNIAALEESYRAQRQATHEFQHHLQTIASLLDGVHSEKAKEYIENLLDTQTKRIFCIQCGHPILDALLNQKYQAARESNIDMQVQVNDLSAVSVPNEMLVILLSNLLDNAIEACRKLPEERTILCRLVLDDTLFLSIQNSTLPVSIADGRIQTTKEPKEAHGFGLANVSRLLDQLGAEYAFAYENNTFRFVAEIPL